MRGFIVVACALVALATAPGAHADVTLGSALGAEPDTAAVCDCTAVFGDLPGRTLTAPYDGIVTRWRIRAGAAADVTPVRLRVIRANGVFRAAVRSSGTVTPAPNTVTAFAARIPIAMGETIGLDTAQGRYFLAGAAVVTPFWTPPLIDGEIERAQSREDNFEPLVNADIERDADTDGFGDETQDNCPTVSGAAPNGCPPPAPPAAPRVNQPPTVRFRTPLAGTAIGPSQAIELEVSDDAGAPTVTVFDDDGTVCTLSAAPYTCTWSPTGADVGRATLLASAVDSDNRSTLGIVRVTVRRFEADLTRRVRGRRVSGRLVLPSGFEPSLGCRGEVAVRRGKIRRTVALKRNCTYSARLPRGGGRVRARFAGNSVLEPAT